MKNWWWVALNADSVQRVETGKVCYIGADSKRVVCAGEPGSISGSRVGGWPHIPAFSSFSARPLQHSLRPQVLGGGHHGQ